MDRVLLDTDILSEVLKARNQTVARNALAYRRHFGHYTLSTIAVMEIVKGLQKAQRYDRVEALTSALGDEEILPFDREAAQIAGRIYGDLDRTGQPIGRADPIVAAIAIQHKLVLVTGNMKHFERILKLGYDLSLHDWRN